MFSLLKKTLTDLWSKVDSSFFLVTTITLLIVLAGEIVVGIYSIEGPEIDAVCVQIGETDCTRPVLGLFYTLVKYTSQATVILMVVTFIYLLLNWIIFLSSMPKKSQKNLPKALIEVLIGSLSASAIPTGLSLIVCAFYDIDLIKYMLGVEVYIAFAGISIISIAFLSTIRQQVQIRQMYPVKKVSEVFHISTETAKKEAETDN